MQDAVTQRFISVFEKLKKQDAVSSQKEFADTLGFPEQYFSGYRAGSRKVSTKIVNKLATLYNVSLNYLLNGMGDMFGGKEEKATYSASNQTNTTNVQGTGNQANGSNEWKLKYDIAQSEIESLKRDAARQEKYIKRLEKQLGIEEDE